MKPRVMKQIVGVFQDIYEVDRYDTDSYDR
jgi:hypothetical protein